MGKRIILLFLVLAVTGTGVFLWKSEAFKKPDPSGTPQHPGSDPAYLVSLGDSVAAGAGLPIASSDSLASLCRQSSEAYPVLVAKAKSLTLKQFACSGATVTAGVLGPQPVGGQSVSSQLTAAAPYLKDSDVLVTIGANDVSWAQQLYTCATTQCETPSNLAAFQQNLGKLSTNLATMLQTLHAHHPRKVVLNTYYPLINDTDTCLSNRGITASKIQWVNAREAELNAAINTAAEKYGDQIVTTRFSGHLLCDAEPWIQTLSDPAPLHPTAAGQAAIAARDALALSL